MQGTAVKIKEETFTIRTHECQADGRVKVVSLMQYLQDIAARHADELGFGFSKLKEIGGYWVLSNFRIEITDMPKWNDQIRIKTWPSGHTRVIATREFIGEDRHGRELFKAGSEWMILDRKKNRPKNLTRLDLQLPSIEPKVLQSELSRLEPHNNYVEADKIHVPYSSIDLNGHVNNTEYIRWGIDALVRTFNLRTIVQYVQTTYLSEVFEGDELVFLVSSDDGGNYHVLGRKSEAESSVFLMQLGCRENIARA